MRALTRIIEQARHRPRPDPPFPKVRTLVSSMPRYGPRARASPVSCWSATAPPSRRWLNNAVST